ncbi:MAG: MarR family winged helix-turn-helix transcriptional regulator [Thermodesulfobacteriota bacterium]
MYALQHKRPVIEELIDEVVALYHLLQVVAARVHADIGLTPAQRGVLKGIERHGPQTVPQMARARPVSRQYIQTIVNQLSQEGLVEVISNPAHRRSGLIRLTPKGEELMTAVAEKEGDFISRLKIDAGDGDLQFAVSVLQKVRDSFDTSHRRKSRQGTADTGGANANKYLSNNS